MPTYDYNKPEPDPATRTVISMDPGERSMIFDVKCLRCLNPLDCEDGAYDCTTCHLRWESGDSDGASTCGEYGTHDQTWCAANPNTPPERGWV